MAASSLPRLVATNDCCALFTSQSTDASNVEAAERQLSLAANWYYRP